MNNLPFAILRGVQAERAFSAFWDPLVSANPRATVFQTSAWYQAWLEAVAGREGAEPIVLRVGSERAPRAALALQRCRVANAGHTLRPLSWPWADYHDAIGSPFDGPARTTLCNALHVLAAEESCPLLLDELVPAGLLDTALSSLGYSAEHASETESVDLTNDTHLERVLGRKEHLTKLRRIQRLGELRCEHHAQPEDIARRLPTFIGMHQAQWQDRTDAVAPFEGGVVNEAFMAMVRHLAPRGLLLLTELLLSGRPIAMYFGFAYGRHYGAYRTTFGGELYRFSPGHLMLREMIADFRAAGFRELDLMRGSYAYKREYANVSSRNRRFALHERLAV